MQCVRVEGYPPASGEQGVCLLVALLCCSLGVAGGCVCQLGLPWSPTLYSSASLSNFPASDSAFSLPTSPRADPNVNSRLPAFLSQIYPGPHTATRLMDLAIPRRAFFVHDATRFNPEKRVSFPDQRLFKSPSGSPHGAWFRSCLIRWLSSCFAVLDRSISGVGCLDERSGLWVV